MIKFHSTYPVLCSFSSGLVKWPIPPLSIMPSKVCPNPWYKIWMHSSTLMLGQRKFLGYFKGPIFLSKRNTKNLRALRGKLNPTAGPVLYVSRRKTLRHFSQLFPFWFLDIEIGSQFMHTFYSCLKLESS